jgi:hypothetical protein
LVIILLSLAEIHTDNEQPAENIEAEAEKPIPKSIIVTDRFRTAETVITSPNLLDFLEKGICLSEKFVITFSLGRLFLGLIDHEEVYAVLEDDGTEVDEEEYFQLLPDETLLMMLSSQQIWSPDISFQG